MESFEVESAKETASVDPSLFDRPFESISEADGEYTDEQFAVDLRKARKPLSLLAERARKALEEGTAQRFPL